VILGRQGQKRAIEVEMDDKQRNTLLYEEKNRIFRQTDKYINSVLFSSVPPESNCTVSRRRDLFEGFWQSKRESGQKTTKRNRCKKTGQE
jgi:hypothetical protein